MVAYLELTNRETGEVHADRRYAVGQYSRYIPLQENDTMITLPQGTKGLPATSGLAKLLKALCEPPCNLPPEILGDKITCLVGIVAEWDMIENNVLPTMLYEVPGQGSPAAPAPAAESDLDKLGIEIASELVKQGPTKRQDLQKACFDRADITQETKVKLMTHVMGEAFTSTLASEAGIVLNGEDLVAPSS